MADILTPGPIVEGNSPARVENKLNVTLTPPDTLTPDVQELNQQQADKVIVTAAQQGPEAALKDLAADAAEIPKIRTGKAKWRSGRDGGTELPVEVLDEPKGGKGADGRWYVFIRGEKNFPVGIPLDEVEFEEEQESQKNNSTIKTDAKKEYVNEERLTMLTSEYDKLRTLDALQEYYFRLLNESTTNKWAVYTLFEEGDRDVIHGFLTEHGDTLTPVEQTLLRAVVHKIDIDNNMIPQTAETVTLTGKAAANMKSLQKYDRESVHYKYGKRKPPANTDGNQEKKHSPFEEQVRIKLEQQDVYAVYELLAEKRYSRSDLEKYYSSQLIDDDLSGKYPPTVESFLDSEIGSYRYLQSKMEKESEVNKMVSKRLQSKIDRLIALKQDYSQHTYSPTIIEWLRDKQEEAYTHIAQSIEQAPPASSTDKELPQVCRSAIDMVKHYSYLRKLVNEAKKTPPPVTPPPQPDTVPSVAKTS